MEQLAPVRLQLKRDIPQESLMRSLMQSEDGEAPLAIIGGFPLYLIGGAMHYGDVDLYAFTWKSFYAWNRRFSNHPFATFVRATQYTTIFKLYDETEYQLVVPARSQPTPESILYTTDITPSACQLVYENAQWNVQVLYPDDIDNRICRILVNHEWTPYRASVYQKKGYTIVNKDGTPYVIPQGWVAPGEIYKPA